jgi:hypothetical protein
MYACWAHLHLVLAQLPSLDHAGLMLDVCRQLRSKLNPCSAAVKHTASIIITSSSICSSIAARGLIIACSKGTGSKQPSAVHVDG